MNYFKTKKIEDGVEDMHRMIRIIMWEAIEFLKDRGYKPTITATFSTEREDQLLGRKSKTHRQGRAFDLRTWDIPDCDVRCCINHFNTLYGYMGAISYTTNLPRLIVWHDAGTGAHLHVQISPNYLEPAELE